MMKVNKMNRMERKALADSRAMEEQKERENPLSGSGAVPSMGLSEVRGGVASSQGKMLKEHLSALYGAGYAKEFRDGMRSRSVSPKKGGLHTGAYEGEGKMKGGYLGLAMLALPLISKLLGAGKMSQEAHDEMKQMIEEHEKKYHGKKMKGGYLGLAMMALPLISKLLGAGQMTKGAHTQLVKLFKEDAPVKGAGMECGRAVGSGKYPSPKHLPDAPPMQLQAGMVGCGNARARRAELVRKVMADRKCGMIEASKIVKSEGMK
jgi:hypothetical protein